MVDTVKMWDILQRDYGIQTMKELETALAKNKGIDIAVFTEPQERERKNYDARRVS